jgi:hypothetical protein
MALLVEHDARRMSAGFRLLPVRDLAVLIVVHQGDGFSAGISYTHQLR